MELGQLRIFLAVIDHHGFRRAAAKLYLSQPAVSRHIAALEHSLGVELFRRENGRTWLTPAGERFAERAERILDDCDAAVREVRGECFRGELKIGVTPGAAAELTQPILRHLALAFPHVHVHRIDLPMLSWSEAPPPGMDLQLVRDPVRAEAARTTTLMDEPMMLATARDDGIPATSISLANAAELPMVRFSQASPRRFVEFWSLAAARSFAAGRFRGEEADRPWHMAEFVARGIGVAIGSPSLCRVFAAESVRSIPIHDGPRVRSLLSSRIEDRRPVVDAAHRQIADLVKRIGPLILPH